MQMLCINPEGNFAALIFELKVNWARLNAYSHTTDIVFVRTNGTAVDAPGSRGASRLFCSEGTCPATALMRT